MDVRQLLDAMKEVYRARQTIALGMLGGFLAILGLAIEVNRHLLLLALFVPMVAWVVDSQIVKRLAAPITLKLLLMEAEGGEENPLSHMMLEFRGYTREQVVEGLALTSIPEIIQFFKHAQRSTTFLRITKKGWVFIVGSVGCGVLYAVSWWVWTTPS